MGLVARLFCLRFAVSIFFSSFSMYLAFFQIQLNSMGCGFFMMIRSELIVGFRARESRKKIENQNMQSFTMLFLVPVRWLTSIGMKTLVLVLAFVRCHLARCL